MAFVPTGIAGVVVATRFAGPLVTRLRQTAFQVGVALGVAVLLSIAASYTNTLLSASHPPSRAAALTSGYSVASLILSVISAVGGLTALVTLRRGTLPQPAKALR